MRRHVKVKTVAVRIPLRRTATSASAAARRNFPAWIDAGESTAAFTASRKAMPRVRDGLVLRKVAKGARAERKVHHASGGR